jgi:hypothetical protein
MFVIENVRLIPNASIGKLVAIENELLWMNSQENLRENLNIFDCESVLIDKLSSTAIFNSQKKGIKMVHLMNNEDSSLLAEYLNTEMEMVIKSTGESYIEYKRMESTDKDEDGLDKRIDLDEATLNVLEAFSKVPLMAKGLIKRLKGESSDLRRPRGIKSQGIPINPWIFDKPLDLPICGMKFDVEKVDKFSSLPESVKIRMIYNSAGKILNSTTRKEFWLSLAARGENIEESFDQIDKENVVRIERDLNRLGEGDNEILIRLEKILIEYSLIDPELGYVQGMADLALPFARLFESQSDALKCFKSLMNRIRSNFIEEYNEFGIESQLKELRRLIEEYNPLLSDYLKFNRDSDDLFFSYRWLLVLFRREFVEIERLWDVMFAAEACEIIKMEEFRIYLALAMIFSQKAQFMKTCSRFEDLLKVNILVKTGIIKHIFFF